MAKRDNEYERRGTANIFGSVEPKAGRHFTCATPDGSAAHQFARPMQTVVTAYPDVRTIHLVMDNLNTHGEKSLTAQFGRRRERRLWRRFTVHHTAKHGSWLNQAAVGKPAFAGASPRETFEETRPKNKSLQAVRDLSSQPC